jgi:hypothetical protein
MSQMPLDVKKVGIVTQEHIRRNLVNRCTFVRIYNVFVVLKKSTYLSQHESIIARVFHHLGHRGNIKREAIQMIPTHNAVLHAETCGIQPRHHRSARWGTNMTPIVSTENDACSGETEKHFATLTYGHAPTYIKINAK